MKKKMMIMMMKISDCGCLTTAAKHFNEVREGDGEPLRGRWKAPEGQTTPRTAP